MRLLGNYARLARGSVLVDDEMRNHAAAGLVGQFLYEDMMPDIVLDDERIIVEQNLVTREKPEGIGREAGAG
jgi:hypothetical protein